MSTIQEATKEYTALNQYAQKNKVAILGASTAAHLAIGELLQDYEISTKVYNRSVEAITIKEAVPFAKTCIVPLKPSRLLLQLGETELETMGLAAPQITYIMHALKEKGMDVPTDATTIEEAADGIMKALKKERAAK